MDLCRGLGTYDGWKIYVKEENLEIYQDRVMYFQSNYHYFENVHKINLLFLYWPTIGPNLILDCTFNDWVLEVAYQNP